MTPEERAQEIVRGHLEPGTGYLLEKDITQALHQYGDERLEEAAKNVDGQSSGDVIAASIRALKHGDTPKGEG